MDNILPPLLAIMTIFFPVWFFSTLFVNALLKLLEQMQKKNDAAHSSHFSKDRETLPGETA
jgi:hypothetical protein